MLVQEIRNRVEDELKIDLDYRKPSGKHSRVPKYVYARAIYYGLCREFSGLSLTEIGETLGQNHATVLHSINNVFSNLEVWNDKFYLKAYNNICTEIEPIKKEIKHRKARENSYLELLNNNIRLQSLLDKANDEVESSGDYKQKYIRANVKLQHLKGLVSKKQSLTQAKLFVEEINLIEE